MLNNYDSLNEMIDGAPVRVADRTTIFIPYKSINSDGTFNTCEFGDSVRTELGLTFIVDKFIPEQYEKLYIDNDGFLPKLKVKDGETIINNETDIEREIRLKEQELLQLKAQYSTVEVV